MADRCRALRCACVKDGESDSKQNGESATRKHGERVTRKRWRENDSGRAQMAIFDRQEKKKQIGWRAVRVNPTPETPARLLTLHPKPLNLNP